MKPKKISKNVDLVRGRNQRSGFVVRQCATGFAAEKRLSVYFGESRKSATIVTEREESSGVALMVACHLPGSQRPKTHTHTQKSEFENKLRSRFGGG